MLTDAPHDPETGEILEFLSDTTPQPDPLATDPAKSSVAAAVPALAAAGPTDEAAPEAAEPTRDAGDPQPPSSKHPSEKGPAKVRAPRARPPATPDEIDEAVKEAQATLLEAGGAGAFARDPYRIALAGLSATIGVLPKFVRRVDAAFTGVVGELAELVRAMRHPLTEAERAILTREVVTTIDRAAKDSIGNAAKDLPRAIDRRSLALVAVTLSVSLAGVGVGAFYAGRSSATEEVRAWVAAQRADLAMGGDTLNSLPVAEARAWSQLIRANPAIREALGKVRDRGTDPTNRPYGSVPLWLDIARTPPTSR